MQITVLIENTTDSDLICEHGLSLWIEQEEKNYLLDAGQTGAFLENAKKMEIPLEEATCAFLSHGHYDHAGGFADYLKQNPQVKVYAMEQITQEYYSGSGGAIHPIGVPSDVYPKYEKQFCLIDKVTKVSDYVYLIPHQTEGLAQIGERAKLYRMQDREYVGDDFAHEMSLVFDTMEGLVIFNSCSHAGVKNIVEEVKSVLPNKPIHVFCGGLHMKGTKNGEECCTFTQQEIDDLVQYIVEEDIHHIYTGHCTGEPGFVLLQEQLGKRIERLVTGKRFEC